MARQSNKFGGHLCDVRVQRYAAVAIAIMKLNAITGKGCGTALMKEVAKVSLFPPFLRCGTIISVLAHHRCPLHCIKPCTTIATALLKLGQHCNPEVSY